MTSRLPAALVAVAWVLLACGDPTGLPKASSTSDRPAPSGLTCPTNERVSTAGGLYAELPDGLPTKSDAVRAWLARAPEFGVSFVIDESNGKAWILREDGTASAKVGFVRHRGFTVHGYDACSPLD